MGLRQNPDLEEKGVGKSGRSVHTQFPFARLCGWVDGNAKAHSLGDLGIELLSGFPAVAAQGLLFVGRLDAVRQLGCSQFVHHDVQLPLFLFERLAFILPLLDGGLKVFLATVQTP